MDRTPASKQEIQVQFLTSAQQKLSWNIMKQFSQALVAEIKKITNQNAEGKRQVVYLEGGYFDTRFGPNDFSTNTLDACIEAADEIIKRPYKIKRVMLGILINNIGMTCGEDACFINTPDVQNSDATIPEPLENLLKKSKVAKEDQSVINERTLRNRGIRTAKEIIKEPKKYVIETEVNEKNETLYSINVDGQKIPLVIKKDNKWVARCPLIMGQHYADLFIKNAKKYGNTTHQLIIDMCEMYDRHKVNNGAKVALQILRNMYGYDVHDLKIMNFSFNDDELENYEFDVTEGSK